MSSGLFEVSNHHFTSKHFKFSRERNNCSLDDNPVHAVAGRGSEPKDEPGFFPLQYDKDINFVDVSVYSDWALAITDKGKLYGWGSNVQRQLSNSEETEFYQPIELEFFKDYIVKDFKWGASTGLISASPKNDLKSLKFFMIGDLKGLGNVEKNEHGVYHHKPYDNLEYNWMEAGNDTNFISIKGEGSSKANSARENVGVHTEYECFVTKQKPIIGTMHFWKQVFNRLHPSREILGYIYQKKAIRQQKKQRPVIKFALTHSWTTQHLLCDKKLH